MSWPLLFALLLSVTVAGYPEPQEARLSPKKTTTTSKKPAASAAKKPAGTSKSTKTSKKARSKKRRPSWRTSQQVPTRERYKEIQQALIDKGYLQGPATGLWGTESVQALKRFQEDQNLECHGKLDALSLIALGLGPRRGLSAAPSSDGSSSAASANHAPVKVDPK